MRRKDKEITESKQIFSIINKAQVCRLAMSEDDIPYIVPVSFGYDGTTLFFHSALKGKKVDMLRANNRVCFEFEVEVEILSDEQKPCGWSCSFQSVIGFGTAKELTSSEEKKQGLIAIMAHYSEKEWDFNSIPLKGLRVWAINIDSMTGKQSPPRGDQ